MQAWHRVLACALSSRAQALVFRTGRRYIVKPAEQKGFVKQWLSTKDDVEGKEGNKRYTLSKVRPAAIHPQRASRHRMLGSDGAWASPTTSM